MSEITEEKISGLQCTVKRGDAKAPAVILLHGFGANQNDLVPLVDYLGLGPRYNWYFPNGILEIIIGPGMTGRAWWPIDMRRYETMLQSGSHADLSVSRPKGMDAAVERVMRLYDEVSKAHEKVILGGFSQGSMLALEVALRAQKKPKGLILLSGNLVDRETTEALVKNNKGLKFIQSHGANDVILSHEGAESLFEVLTSGGMIGNFISFRGGHEIPPQVLREVGKFIATQS
jgi:phospholipase/carboxylesterase